MNTRNAKKKYSMLSVIILLSLTDLAFSIDCITTAIAISDLVLLVITGALIGVLALRFTSALFIRLLNEYDRLEMAGYFAVGFVGFKLLLETFFAKIDIPEIFVFTFMILVFSWGFSSKAIYR